MNFKKILTISLFITFSILVSFEVSFAQLSSEVLNQIGERTGLPGFEDSDDPRVIQEDGVDIVTSFLFTIVDVLTYFVGILTVIFLVVTGFRAIIAGRFIDDVINKQKENLRYMFTALAVMFMANVMVNVIFGREGDRFDSSQNIEQGAALFNAEFEGGFTLIQIIIGAIAVLFLIINSIRLIGGFGNEEAMAKFKKQVGYSITGLILVGVAEFFIKDIVFPKQGTEIPNAVNAIDFFVVLTNWISGIISLIAVPMFLYGGFLYVVSFGNEDQTGKAKKVLTGAIIGLVLAMGAFALVNTITAFQG